MTEVEVIREFMSRFKNMCSHYKNCEDCPFFGRIGDCCPQDDLTEDDYKTVMNWKPPVDWSNVAVDTKILVWDNENEQKRKRYFAKYKDGNVYSWLSGMTSWSTPNDNLVLSWKHAELAEEVN